MDNPERVEVHNSRTREVNRDSAAASNRRWYAAHREQKKAAALARHEASPYRASEAQRRWREANPNIVKARNQRRRARIRNAVCEHGPGCVDAVFLTSVYSSQCLYCDGAAEHADHFVPVARGGLHCRDNVVPACAACNSSKAASDPHEWLAGRLTG